MHYIRANNPSSNSSRRRPPKQQSDRAWRSRGRRSVVAENPADSRARSMERAMTAADQVFNIYCLHRGRSRHPIVRIIPKGALFRIEWPDIGFSHLTNLTRARAAALEWAERQALTEDRKTSVARRLKSLNNFWWSSSYSAPNERAAA
jgi:hypothetical protein